MSGNPQLEHIRHWRPWLPYRIWEIVEDSEAWHESWNAWHYHPEIEFLSITEGMMEV